MKNGSKIIAIIPFLPVFTFLSKAWEVRFYSFAEAKLEETGVLYETKGLIYFLGKIPNQRQI